MSYNIEFADKLKIQEISGGLLWKVIFLAHKK